MNRPLLIGVVSLGILGVLALLAWLIYPAQDGPDQEENIEPQQTQENEVPQLPYTRQVIGHSGEGREIVARTYGTGDTNLLFVGGMHGGYEWNSVLVAYAFMDYLDANPDVLPDDISVTVIPSLNPDGVQRVVGAEGRFSPSDAPLGSEITAAGRFNANGVDINRNFACKWQPESTWRGAVVSAGSEPFSEPEAQALRDLIVENAPRAAFFWHSQGDAVYASECESGILPETLVLMETYAHAAGYQPIPSFDAYEITGDAEGWLASIGIPALTIELSTHETVEWEQNRAGIEAILAYFKESARAR